MDQRSRDPTDASQEVLGVSQLAIGVGGRSLIDKLTQSFGAGQLWCVVGPNGAGKTTLLHTLAGIAAPRAGAIRLFGQALTTLRPVQQARYRALMPQTLPEAFDATVEETVMVARHPWLRGWGWESAADRRIVAQALDEVGVGAWAARLLSSLSGGERQRVALAAALAQQVALLLLDEPLAHLDVGQQIACMALLERQTRERGATVLMSCHDLNLSRAFATHALLLNGKGGALSGPAAQVLTLENLSSTFGHPFVLLGEGARAALLPQMPSFVEPLANRGGPGHNARTGTVDPIGGNAE
ncbi:MAG: ABC transporter ATP-binding protein [Janthinobacterium lividum]